MNTKLIEPPPLAKPTELKRLPQIKMLAMPHLDIENHVWITACDKEISVRGMTSQHIENCIACWNGVGNKIIPSDYLGGREKWLKIFHTELLNRQ